MNYISDLQVTDIMAGERILASSTTRPDSAGNFGAAEAGWMGKAQLLAKTSSTKPISQNRFKAFKALRVLARPARARS